MGCAMSALHANFSLPTFQLTLKRKQSNFLRVRTQLFLLLWAAGALFVHVTSVFFAVNLGGDQAAEGILRLKQPEINGNALLLSSPQQRRQNDGTSACLLVMDANHLLVEWLAYHYHVLRLRHLIIAVDMRSLTSPNNILKRWTERINIEIWPREERYIDLQVFHQEVNERMEMYQRETANVKLSAHRIRQKKFNMECIKTHKKNGRGWTFLTDVDEFTYINPRIKNESDQLYLPNWEKLPLIQEPDSVYTMLEYLIFPKNRYGIKYPCVRIARRQFSSNEDKKDYGLDGHGGFEMKNFQTLRWRKWGFHDPFHSPLAGKAIMDLGRLRFEDIVAEYDDELFGDPHIPLPSICSGSDLEEDALLIANHYMGTREQWNFRTNDARGNGCMQRLFDHQNRITGKYDGRDIISWLGGFIDNIGVEEAARLLHNVGKVESLDHAYELKRDRVINESKYTEPFSVGDRIVYIFENKWYTATVMASNCRGGYDVMCDDGSWDYNLSADVMILLSR